MKGNLGGNMPKKLLLAEDSLTIRKIFELVLSRSDIAVTAVDNAEDTVRLAGETRPDLVVVDITLPGKNGYEVAAQLNASEATRKIPVLLLSGTLVPVDEARLRECGAKDVLFKPFEFRDLMEKIANLLRGEEAPPETPSEAPPPVDEHWDFSDVLEEVGKEAGTGEASVTSPPAAKPAGSGEILPGGESSPTIEFNEFDVSLDEIEGTGKVASAETIFAAVEPPAGVGHIEGDVVCDAPPPVTDISRALGGEEDAVVFDLVEETESLPPDVPTASLEAPASLRNLPVESSAPAPAQAVEAPSEPPRAEVEESPRVPSAMPPPGAPDESRPEDAELRRFFAERAGEIFRTVAQEAVEKVMWEMTDRLATEFSARLREAVEGVSWEVIPSTAEALIREEIARIRERSGKPSP